MVTRCELAISLNKDGTVHAVLVEVDGPESSKAISLALAGLSTATVCACRCIHRLNTCSGRTSLQDDPVLQPSARRTPA